MSARIASRRIAPDDDPPGTITWAEVVDVEPRLEDLRREVASDTDRSWPAYVARKGHLQELVGWFALRRDLPRAMYSSRAFDVAFYTVMRGRW